ncbi:hypothetical protein H0H92_005308 [Tricholoma furcatifolium]|nr:hypothetical protein H0H92_005308 [Tricholoma furcatifolium]
MSRGDTHGFDIPPGLQSQRSRGFSERESPTYGPGPMFSTGDRRASQGMLSYTFTRDYREEGPNRHNFTSTNGQPFGFNSSYNHHPRPSPATHTATSSLPSSSSLPSVSSLNATLCWSDIEPWMDEEYAKQVCALMGWDPVHINVPHPAPDPVTGQQSNNPGFCFLTFPTAAQAAQVLAQINGPTNTNNPIAMPNSSKPFVVNWASSAQSISPVSSAFPHAPTVATNPAQHHQHHQQYPKEYSIFVGDLAPETSNSDLVAVFRNPVLGLRNDREPKFIRPFTSCKSAKIMLDPVTGVSRGYGFVRFTDEADQQRALIEMHGLYCLSRPMRISPATAKFKGPMAAPPQDLPQVQFPSQMTMESQTPPVSVALPLPNSNLTKSVSLPMAASTSNTSNSSVSASASNASLGTSNSTASMSSSSTSSSMNSNAPSSGFGSLTPEEMMNLPNNVLLQVAQQYASGEANPVKSGNGASISQPFAQDSLPPRQISGQGESGAPRYGISEESWKHHAQARAILGNLIGPNGEQLTSTDPYNTTVFVGGLSPLISEETLRTFFSPFGDIHYVKVPVGKHCGFVQFVKKADAERAIEKMQGFPIGGSRIRLSWGRSQCLSLRCFAGNQADDAWITDKAAQAAAAQAAQAAALQAQASQPPSNVLTQEQAMILLQKLSLHGYLDNIPSALVDPGQRGIARPFTVDAPFPDMSIQESVLGGDSHFFDSFSSNGYQPRPVIQRAQSSFAPFSPEPNAFTSSEIKPRESFSRSEGLPHPSKAYASGFFPPELKSHTEVGGPRKPSPTSARPTSATRALDASSAFAASRAPGRSEAAIGRPTETVISRPNSGQTRRTSDAALHTQKELDYLHDLTGTLANLDFDRPGAASVQYKVSSERTPSPANKA